MLPVIACTSRVARTAIRSAGRDAQDVREDAFDVSRARVQRIRHVRAPARSLAESMSMHRQRVIEPNVMGRGAYVSWYAENADERSSASGCRLHVAPLVMQATSTLQRGNAFRVSGKNLRVSV